jgi:hypothetical protein
MREELVGGWYLIVFIGLRRPPVVCQRMRRAHLARSLLSIARVSKLTGAM